MISPVLSRNKHFPEPIPTNYNTDAFGATIYAFPILQNRNISL